MNDPDKYNQLYELIIENSSHFPYNIHNMVIIEKYNDDIDGVVISMRKDFYKYYSKIIDLSLVKNE